MRYRIIGIIYLICAITLFAREPFLNTLTVEQETARYALSGNWDAVIRTGKTALAQGIDFYNLRYRMGIAYYHLGNYHAAARHFYRAYRINDTEPLLKEYLYWAYRYAGHEADARVLAAGFTQELKRKAGVPDQYPGDYLSISFNAGFPVDKSFTDSYVNDTGLAVNGSQFLSKTLNYADVGIQKSLSPRLSAYVSYARLKKTSYLYAQENGYAVVKPDYETNLNQVYISGTYHVIRGTDLTIGAHFINIFYQRDRYVFNGLEGRIVTDEISDNDKLVFMSVRHRFPYVTTGITSIFSNLNQKDQVQGDLQLTFYPLGNLNLYGGCILTYLHQNSGENTVITELLLGGKLLPVLWADAIYSTGDLHNASRYQGYVVYNGMDVITRRIGGRWIIPVSEDLTVRLNYAYQKHESSFHPENTGLTETNRIHYKSHSITGALQWNF
ncbi:MAG: hypothetical protein DRP86_00685 [Candidatus Neomarinimicrobiota bacterium]|nr:MAG: hypothetical protein DRP86_00685 [Candidatus Neomarinimicrobiota bacterium]